MINLTFEYRRVIHEMFMSKYTQEVRVFSGCKLYYGPNNNCFTASLEI